MLFQNEDFYEQMEDLVQLSAFKMQAGRVKQEMKGGDLLPKNALYWILQSILQDAAKLEFGKCLFQTAIKEGEIETYLAFCKCVVEMTVFV